jgi:hypothetical protein
VTVSGLQHKDGHSFLIQSSPFLWSHSQPASSEAEEEEVGEMMGEPRSWGEDLRMREAARRGLALDGTCCAPKFCPPPAPVIVKCQEFDIVTGIYRDSAKESLVQQREQEMALKVLKGAINGQKYNIVSHGAPPGQDGSEKQPRAKQPDSRTPYNILSNLTREEQSSQTLCSETFLSTCFDESDSHKKKPVRRNRAYDILSNEQLIFDAPGDPERPPADVQLKNAFDPITGTFRDRERDRIHRAKFALSKTHASAWEKRLPPTIQKSEDHAYDLINKELRYPSIAANATKRDSLAQRRLARERIAQYQKSSQATADAQGERSVRRANWQRFHASHGYDVISNRQIGGGRCGAPERKSPVVSAPSPSWQRLHVQQRPSTTLGSQSPVPSHTQTAPISAPQSGDRVASSAASSTSRSSTGSAAVPPLNFAKLAICS